MPRILAAPLLAALAAGAPSAAAQSPSGGARSAEAAAAEVTQLELSFDAPEGRPGAVVQVTARLLDAAGRPRDATLRLEADAGALEGPSRRSPGVFAARLTVPALLGSRRTILVVANAGAAVATAVLPLTAGPAASIQVEAPTDLPADGANHPLWISVADAHGNPSDEPPRLTADRGALGEPVPVGPGGWMIDYHPPRSAAGGRALVRVQAGAAVGSRVLELRPVPASLTLAPKVGVVFGAGGPAFAAAADVATWFEAGGVELGVVLGVAWWGDRSTGAVSAPGGSLDLRFRRGWLPITLSVASRHPLGGRVEATFHLGGGGALVTSRADLAGQPRISRSGFAPAVIAGAELALRTRFGAPFVEVRGGWLGDPRLDTVRGAAWPVLLLLGARFDAL